MGAWGTGPLDNDDALDWAARLMEEKDARLVMDALFDARLAADMGEMDAYTAQVALAAAAIVVAAVSGTALDQPHLDGWIREDRQALVRAKGAAAQAVRNVLAASELEAMWRRPEDLAAWRARTEKMSRYLS